MPGVTLSDIGNIEVSNWVPPPNNVTGNIRGSFQRMLSVSGLVAVNYSVMVYASSSNAGELLAQYTQMAGTLNLVVQDGAFSSAFQSNAQLYSNTLLMTTYCQAVLSISPLTILSTSSPTGIIIIFIIT